MFLIFIYIAFYNIELGHTCPFVFLIFLSVAFIVYIVVDWLALYLKFGSVYI